MTRFFLIMSLIGIIGLPLLGLIDSGFFELEEHQKPTVRRFVYISMAIAGVAALFNANFLRDKETKAREGHYEETAKNREDLSATRAQTEETGRDVKELSEFMKANYGQPQEHYWDRLKKKYPLGFVVLAKDSENEIKASGPLSRLDFGDRESAKVLMNTDDTITVVPPTIRVDGIPMIKSKEVTMPSSPGSEVTLGRYGGIGYCQLEVLESQEGTIMVVFGGAAENNDANGG